MLHTFVNAVVAGFAIPLAAGLLMMSPVAAIGWMLQRRRAAYMRVAAAPFTELPLRPPGESLRVKMEELNEQFDTQLVAMLLVGVVAFVIAEVAPRQAATLGTLGLLACVGYVIFGRRVFRLAEEMWKYRLAFTGERVVGEELNQLLSRGFRVFHDVPFDGFNIDHVVVGTPGVYVVETKTRRKPADVKGAARATVVFDGNALHFPKFTDTAAIAQARLNAATLSKWLAKATGERVAVKAIVTLPGWFVERRACGDVNVLNPGEVKHCFPARVAQPLTGEQLQRIAHQLSERCRMPK